MPPIAAFSTDVDRTHRQHSISSDLRAVLRAATADSHIRLDRLLTSCELTRLEGYRRFLSINAAALIPTEAALRNSGAAELVPDWVARTRSSALINDLDLLEAIPVPLPAPRTRLTYFEILGALYVLEGSRLGAQYLWQTVKTSSDPRILNATAFLRHGSGQRLWQSFLHLLQNQEPSPQDQADAVSAARATFSRYLLAADLA